MAGDSRKDETKTGESRSWVKGRGFGPERSLPPELESRPSSEGGETHNPFPPLSRSRSALVLSLKGGWVGKNYLSLVPADPPPGPPPRRGHGDHRARSVNPSPQNCGEAVFRGAPVNAPSDTSRLIRTSEALHGVRVSPLVQITTPWHVSPPHFSDEPSWPSVGLPAHFTNFARTVHVASWSPASGLHAPSSKRRAGCARVFTQTSLRV